MIESNVLSTVATETFSGSALSRLAKATTLAAMGHRAIKTKTS